MVHRPTVHRRTDRLGSSRLRSRRRRSATGRDAHKGSRIVVYGDVTQFDVVTGPTMFRADTTATADGDDSILSGTNTIVMGSKAELAPVVQGDKVKIFAEVIGSDSYENALGNEMAVLTLTANMVEVLPPS